MRALVTGGGGFIGRRLVAFLRARGDAVTVVGRRAYPDLERLGAACAAADICDSPALGRAMAGCDVVYHLAAKVGTWGDRREFDRVNVDGVCSALDAARAAGVPRFIHASTPSVVGYSRDVENGGQDLPYASRSGSVYADSKAAGERMVLAANGPGLATVALRPHLVIGPGDLLTVQKFIDRAKAGRLRIIGEDRNRIDLTYVDNAAWAFVDAEAALVDHRSPCAGRAYFISNAEPVLIWPFMNGLLRDLGLPEVRKRVPEPLVYSAGAICEAVWRLLRLSGEPPATRFLVRALARSHWYDMGPAARDLGYRPRVSMAEARERIVEWAKAVENAR